MSNATFNGNKHTLIPILGRQKALEFTEIGAIRSLQPSVKHQIV